MSESETDLCIKCNKSGKLLICSDNGCLIAVHENCLGYTPNFNETGTFYCPYCLYRQAIAELNKAKENVLAKKKSLSAFLDEKILDCDKEKTQEDQECVPDSEDDISLSNEINDVSSDEEDRVDQFEFVRVQQSVEEPKFGTDQENNSHVVKENINESSGESLKEDETSSAKEKENESSSAKEKEDETFTSSDESMPEIRLDSECNNIKNTPEEKGYTTEEEEEEEDEVVQASKSMPENHLVDEEEEEHSVKQNVDFMRRSSLRVKKVSGKKIAKKSSNSKEFSAKSPRSPFGKRKRLLWTEDEEEMLKEGVRIFSLSANKNLPWKKIYEFGCHVFNSTRTPTDLKDKWRKMSNKQY